MTLPEVLVSAVILGISSHASLQGWSATTARAVSAEQRQQQLQQLDQQVLAAGRLLSRLSLDSEDCRFPSHAVAQLTAAMPISAPLQQGFELDSSAQGIWLELERPGQPQPLQRRVRFTPAGLGLCGEIDR